MRYRRHLSMGLFLLVFYFLIGFFLSFKIIIPNRKTLPQHAKELKIASLTNYLPHMPEKIAFPTKDGLTLKGYYIPPTKECGLIFHHGYSNTRLGMLKYARLFRNSGCAMLLYDARGHGESEGNYITYGAIEKFDVEEALKWLQEKTDIPTDRIALIGESFGASTVLQYAGYSEKPFWFILADSPYSEFKRILVERAEYLYGQWILIFFPVSTLFAQEFADFSIEEASVLRYANRIQSPVFLVHSKSDTYTVYPHSIAITKRLKQADLFLTNWGAKHAKSIDTNPTAYQQRLKSFFKKAGIDLYKVL